MLRTVKVMPLTDARRAFKDAPIVRVGTVLPGGESHPPRPLPTSSAARRCEPSWIVDVPLTMY